MTNKKIIVFDMDGVIIDSIELMFQLNQNLLPGSSRKDLERLFIGNIHEQIDNLRYTYGVGKVSEEEHNSLCKKYTKEKTKIVEMYPGVLELLRELKTEGYRLSINTSASDDNTLDLLKRLNIKNLFDYIITRDFTRSKVDKFKELARLYECEPNDFLFITDSLGDVLEAKEVNVPTIAVTWGVHPREYFNGNELLAVVDSVGELKRIILK